MKSNKKATRREPGYVPPPIDPGRLEQLRLDVMAGDVVQTRSIEECCALLALLAQYGKTLIPRSHAAKERNPWLFVVGDGQRTGDTL